ncbi:MAG: hypothetical protein ABL936_05405 [Aestuariivirga sp.]
MGKFAALIAICLSATAASAGEITSIYSDLDLKACKALELFPDEGEGGIWACKGIKGFDVLYLEGDLRGYIAFGPEGRSQCTSAQTFGAFNSPGPKIEWRMENGKPVATILRWFTDNGSGEANAKQNWLVVTKLNGKDACRTALIDTKYPDANIVAREKADRQSRSFACEKDMPEVVSQRAVRADELMSGLPCPGGPYREE